MKRIQESRRALNNVVRICNGDPGSRYPEEERDNSGMRTEDADSQHESTRIHERSLKREEHT